MLARASYYNHVSLGPQDLDRSLGRRVRPYTETRKPIRPKDPAVPRGGECYKARPGLGNRSILYPGTSVGTTSKFGVKGIQHARVLVSCISIGSFARFHCDVCSI